MSVDSIVFHNKYIIMLSSSTALVIFKCAILYVRARCNDVTIFHNKYMVILCSSIALDHCKLVLQRCKYCPTLLASCEGVMGSPISRKKCYVTLEWPSICTQVCMTMSVNYVVILHFFHCSGFKAS